MTWYTFKWQILLSFSGRYIHLLSLYHNPYSKTPKIHHHLLLRTLNHPLIPPQMTPTLHLTALSLSLSPSPPPLPPWTLAHICLLLLPLQLLHHLHHQNDLTNLILDISKKRFSIASHFTQYLSLSNLPYTINPWKMLSGVQPWIMNLMLECKMALGNLFHQTLTN